MTPGTLEETGRRIARAQWLERRCFEILGGWVPTTADPEAKLLFARQSHHHAWHAELFERVLPSANGFADPIQPGPPSAWAPFLDELAQVSGSTDRLAGAFAVLLPAKLAEYERWRDDVDPVRDAPLLRWLRFVITDEGADLAEGRALLTARGDADRAPAWAALEASLARAGGLWR